MINGNHVAVLFQFGLLEIFCASKVCGRKVLFGFMCLHDRVIFSIDRRHASSRFLSIATHCVRFSLVSLRCHLFLLHHPSTVQSKNQNFSLETLLSEVMHSLLFLAGQTQECVLAFQLCAMNPAHGHVHQVLFVSFQKKEME